MMLVVFLVESLVALCWVDGEVSEEFSFVGDDAHVAVGDVEKDFCSFVLSADHDVAEGGAVSEGDFA